MFSHMFFLSQSLLLVFLLNCKYLLLSQCQYIVHAPPCSWNRTQGFLKSKTLVEPSSSSTTGTFSPFRTQRKASAVNVHWTDMTHTFLSPKNPRADTFLRQLSYAVQPKQESRRIQYPTREKKVDCCLSYDAFLLTLCSKGIVRPFLATNALQRDLQPA